GISLQYSTLTICIGPNDFRLLFTFGTVFACFLLPIRRHPGKYRITDVGGQVNTLDTDIDDFQPQQPFTHGIQVEGQLAHQLITLTRYHFMQSATTELVTQTIRNPLRQAFSCNVFIATGGDENVAAERLAQRVADGLRNQFGRRTLHEVVSGKRDELMSELTFNLNAVSEGLLGLEVIDIRIKRIDLPTDVSDSVFARMAADRE